MIEHAIILSAGLGSRLLPITEARPKCLVEVGGRTILSHQLAALAQAGIVRATVVVGYLQEQVAAAVAGDQPLQVETRFNPFWAVASSIGSVWMVRDKLTQPFCLLNGDTLFDPAILEKALSSPRAGLGLVVEPITGASYDDMLVQVAEGQVAGVRKDLPETNATHRSLGMIVADGGQGNYARMLDEVIAERNGAAAYHHQVVDRLARAGSVAAIERAAGYWQEIDRPDDISTWRAQHEAGTAHG